MSDERKSPWGKRPAGPPAKPPREEAAAKPPTRPTEPGPTAPGTEAPRDEQSSAAGPWSTRAAKPGPSKAWAPPKVGKPSAWRGGKPDPSRETRTDWRGGGRDTPERSPGPSRDASRPPRAESARPESPRPTPARREPAARERSAPVAADSAVPRRGAEHKICGLNAARAAFAARPNDLRKVYLNDTRIGALREVLAFCVAHRLGYRVVDDAELERITGSSHHEGVCLVMLPPPVLDLRLLLAGLPADAPARLLWLDGVGNPHNLGAVLRSAAHFGVRAVLLPPESPLGLSAAAARVAEGGAEHVPLLHLGEPEQDPLEAEVEALGLLAQAGFQTLATLPKGAPSLYAQALPERALFVFGAEGSGMQQSLIERCDQRVSIPGSGQVESLNIANAVAVVLAEHWRQHTAG